MGARATASGPRRARRGPRLVGRRRRPARRGDSPGSWFRRRVRPPRSSPRSRPRRPRRRARPSSVHRAATRRRGRPAIVRRSVVLPTPEGPTMPERPPAGRRRRRARVGVAARPRGAERVELEGRARARGPAGRALGRAGRTRMPERGDAVVPRPRDLNHWAGGGGSAETRPRMPRAGVSATTAAAGPAERHPRRGGEADGDGRDQTRPAKATLSAAASAAGRAAASLARSTSLSASTQGSPRLARRAPDPCSGADSTREQRRDGDLCVGARLPVSASREATAR